MVVALSLAALLLHSVYLGKPRDPPPIHNPAFLNIGQVCKWESRCIKKQRQAMNRALKYVQRHRSHRGKFDCATATHLEAAREKTGSDSTIVSEIQNSGPQVSRGRTGDWPGALKSHPLALVWKGGGVGKGALQDFLPACSHFDQRCSSVCRVLA